MFFIVINIILIIMVIFIIIIIIIVIQDRRTDGMTDRPHAMGHGKNTILSDDVRIVKQEILLIYSFNEQVSHDDQCNRC